MDHCPLLSLRISVPFSLAILQSSLITTLHVVSTPHKCFCHVIHVLPASACTPQNSSSTVCHNKLYEFFPNFSWKHWPPFSFRCLHLLLPPPSSLELTSTQNNEKKTIQRSETRTTLCLPFRPTPQKTFLFV